MADLLETQPSDLVLTVTGELRIPAENVAAIGATLGTAPLGGLTGALVNDVASSLHALRGELGAVAAGVFVTTKLEGGLAGTSLPVDEAELVEP